MKLSKHKKLIAPTVVENCSRCDTNLGRLMTLQLWRLSLEDRKWQPAWIRIGEPETGLPFSVPSKHGSVPAPSGIPVSTLQAPQLQDGRGQRRQQPELRGFPLRPHRSTSLIWTIEGVGV